MRTATQFWDFVSRPIGKCWPWTGARNPKGYGEVNWHGRKTYAHRVALLLQGEKLDGLDACHKCDNPSCCKPSHLYAGTRKQNMSDFAARGHGNRGESNGQGRLTVHDVAAIRAAHAAAERSSGGKRVKKGTLQSLAKQFRCTASNINQIINGNHWRGNHG